MGTTEVWLVRHGETEWSRDARHTSTTDLPLTDVGEEMARALPGKLTGVDFDLVLTSPRQRARRTAELAGFADAEVDDDLVEWAYGDYEGVTTATVRETRPGWTVWADGSPNGETVQQAGERTDRVIARALAADGDVIVFAHGHILRVLAARWIGLPPERGASLALDTAAVSELGFERETRVITRWNG